MDVVPRAGLSRAQLQLGDLMLQQPRELRSERASEEKGGPGAGETEWEC